jgi:hypothetical protein
MGVEEILTRLDISGKSLYSQDRRAYAQFWERIVHADLGCLPGKQDPRHQDKSAKCPSSRCLATKNHDCPDTHVVTRSKRGSGNRVERYSPLPRQNRPPLLARLPPPGLGDRPREYPRLAGRSGPRKGMLAAYDLADRVARSDIFAEILQPRCPSHQRRPLSAAEKRRKRKILSNLSPHTLRMVDKTF